MPRPVVWRSLSAAVLFGSVVLLVGCRSAVSTHVTRSQEDCGWDTRKLRGVPVTVKIPTHLELRVMERRYVNADGGPLVVGNDCLTARRVEVSVREKDEMFTVDAVRPAAGKIDYSAEFRGQFFKSFNSKVEDKTIESITNAITNITGELGKLPKGRSTSTTLEEKGVAFVDSLVAARVFEVSAPDRDEQIREFLETYINGCAPPCPPPHCPPPVVVLPVAPPVIPLQQLPAPVPVPAPPK
jgi:hypothetical protein